MLVYIVTVSINIYEFYTFYMNAIVVAINMKNKINIRCHAADQVIPRDLGLPNRSFYIHQGNKICKQLIKLVYQ